MNADRLGMFIIWIGALEAWVDVIFLKAGNMNNEHIGLLMRFSSLNWHVGALSLMGMTCRYLISTFFEASKLPVVRWSQNPRC